MIYSLFELYYESGLTLEEVLSDYVDNYYLKKYSKDKASKVIKKAIETEGMNELNGQALKDRDFKDHYPKYDTFVSAIKKSLWFSFQSDYTIVLAVLAAAVDWNKRTNRLLYIIDEETFRDNILQIFKKYQIIENVLYYQNYLSINRQSLHVKYEKEKQKKAEEFANGIRWFVYKTLVDFVSDRDIRISDDNPIIKLMKISIDSAEGAGDIKRIARNLGVDWGEVVDKAIKTVMVLKDNSFFTLGSCGDSIDIIKFLERFDHRLHSGS